MTLTTHSVTLRVNEPQPGGAALDGTWTLDVLAANRLLRDLDGHAVIVGPQTRTTTGGVLVWELPALPQPGIDPQDAHYRLGFMSEDRRHRVTTEPFQLTADVTLDDLLKAVAENVSPSLAAQAVAARDEAAAAAEAAEMTLAANLAVAATPGPKGDPGEPGPKGDPGEPGSDASVTDAAIAAQIANGTATRGALSAVYAALNPNALVANLPTPFYIAHRGGPLLAGEESLTAYRTAVSGGAHALEMDLRVLADGTLVTMHDATVDRTTLGTGNVADFSAASWQKLVINHAALVGGSGWPTDHAPLAEQILREFGNKVTLCPQIYVDAALPGLNRLVDSLGVDKRTLLVQTSSPATAATIAANGYPTMVVGSSLAALNFTSLKAAGVGYVSAPNAEWTSATVAAVHAAGLKAVPYAPTGHYARDALLALGVDAMFTDAPGYMRETTLYRTTDSFRAQARQSGQLVNSGGDGTFTAPNIFNLSGSKVVTLGYLRPADGSNFTVTFEAQFTAGTAVAGTGLYLFAGKSDYFSFDGRTTQDGILLDACDGYRVGAFGDGLLKGIRLDNNVNAANILTNGTSPFALNTWATYRFTVTPTTLRWEQVGVGTPTNLARAEHRPLRYFALGTSTGTTVDFRNVTIT